MGPNSMFMMRMLCASAVCLAAAACGSNPEKSAIARYEAMDLPIEMDDMEKLEELALEAMASNPRFSDMAVYRIKVLPALSTDQRIYRLHLFMPSGPALWVARDREAFGKKIKEETVVLDAEQTRYLFDVINASGVLGVEGRCPALTDAGGQGNSKLVLDGVMLSFDMTIKGDYRYSECSLGLGAPVEAVAEAFAYINGESLVED